MYFLESIFLIVEDAPSGEKDINLFVFTTPSVSDIAREMIEIPLLTIPE